MKTRKIKFSATNNTHYIARMNANDYSATYSLHRVKGLLPKGSEMTSEVLKFVNEKPDVILQFPSVESIERIIDNLIDLRAMMLRKKGEEENNGENVMDVIGNALAQATGGTVEIQSITPEQAIQMIRSHARSTKGRMPRDLRSLVSTLDRVKSNMDKLAKIMREEKQEPKAEKKETTADKAEPAVQ